MDAPPPVEKRIALDLARHGLLVAPVVVVAAGLFGGVDGAASAALGLGVCVLNFFAAAVSLEWGARRVAGTRSWRSRSVGSCSACCRSCS